MSALREQIMEQVKTLMQAAITNSALDIPSDQVYRHRFRTLPDDATGAHLNIVQGGDATENPTGFDNVRHVTRNMTVRLEVTLLGASKASETIVNQYAQQIHAALYAQGVNLGLPDIVVIASPEEITEPLLELEGNRAEATFAMTYNVKYRHSIGDIGGTV